MTVSFAHLERTIGLGSIHGVLSRGADEVFRPVVGDCLFQFLFGGLVDASSLLFLEEKRGFGDGRRIVD